MTANGVTKSMTMYPGTEIVANFDELKQDIYETSSLFIYDPFRLTEYDGAQPISGTYAYSGTLLYTMEGNIISSEEIPDSARNGSLEDDISYFILYDASGMNSTYKPTIVYIGEITDEEGETYTVEYESYDDIPVDENGNKIPTTEYPDYRGEFIHPYINMGLNYLKKPEPIAWGTGSYKAQFFLQPFICSPVNRYVRESKDTDVYTLDTSFTPKHSGSGSCIGSPVAGGTGYHGISANRYPEDYTFAYTSEYLGVRIPDHAKSVICELHIDSSSLSSYSLVTSSEYEAYPDLSSLNISQIVDLNSISNSRIPSFQTYQATRNADGDISQIINTQGIKVLFNKNTNTTCPDKFTVEFPLYRDKYGQKFFSFAITASNNWAMRAIGYRA